MARIRTIKPDLFKHEDLFDLEQSSGLPIRVAFMGLFTCCDREGRFKWRPRTVKIDVLPHDDVDFSRVLDALASRGFIRKYVVDGQEYGVIPTFARHQVINNRESESELPPPPEPLEESTVPTREARVEYAMSTPLVHAQAEGKGKEGKGREEEGEGVPTETPGHGVAVAAAKAPRQKPETDTSQTWTSYSDAYRSRYQAEPVRNATVNSQMAQFVRRLGVEEAPHVARFYVGHQNAFYVRNMHTVGNMLNDAEKLRTEWITKTTMTQTRAQQIDKTQTNLDSFAPLIEEARAREAKNGK